MRVGGVAWRLRTLPQGGVINIIERLLSRGAFGVGGSRRADCSYDDYKHSSDRPVSRGVAALSPRPAFRQGKMLKPLLFVVVLSGGGLCAELPAGARVVPAPVEPPPPPAGPVYRPEPAPEHTGLGNKLAEPFSIDFLSDQPAPPGHPDAAEAAVAGEVLRPAYGYAPQEVTYPDVPYAPGYGYEPAYPQHTAFDRYGNALGAYYEPEPQPEPYEPPTALSLLWSAVPDARGVASLAGRCLGWMASSAFVLSLGAALLVAACSVTGACAVSFSGWPGTLTEQLRSLAAPDRLERAAGLLQRALRNYRAMQHEPELSVAAPAPTASTAPAAGAATRTRRALFS